MAKFLTPFPPRIVTKPDDTGINALMQKSNGCIDQFCYFQLKHLIPGCISLSLNKVFAIRQNENVFQRRATEVQINMNQAAPMKICHLN